jgi:hypothetical protein
MWKITDAALVRYVKSSFEMMVGFVIGCPELLQTSLHWADCFRGTVAQSRALYDNRIEELLFAYRFVSDPGRYRPLKTHRFVSALFVADPSSPTASLPTARPLPLRHRPSAVE